MSTYDKAQSCTDRNKGLDAEDSRKATATDKKNKDKQEKAEKECMAADAVGLTTVGQNGKDTKITKEANDSIQKNLGSQRTNTTAG